MHKKQAWHVLTAGQLKAPCCYASASVMKQLSWLGW